MFLGVLELKKSIIEEGHRSGLSIHPGATKMYQDLKKLFWWPDMKKEVSEFVYACLTCRKSNIEHQKSLGLMNRGVFQNGNKTTFIWILCQVS